jgi:hypothetical protein
MSDASSSGTSGKRDLERRRHITLRELLDEMIEIARHLSQRSPEMSPAELLYARERMEWLADEIWDHAMNAGSRKAP